MRRYELKQKRRDVATCNAPKAHMLGDQAKQKRTGVVEDVQMSEAVVLAAIRFSMMPECDGWLTCQVVLDMFHCYFNFCDLSKRCLDATLQLATRREPIC